MVASITFANGLLSIITVLVIRFQEHPQFLNVLLPFGLYHWSRLLTAAFGFLLIYLSLHLVHRKRVAWWLTILLLILLIGTQLIRNLGYANLTPAGTIVLLLFLRTRFTVRSEPTSMFRGLTLMVITLLLALAYGTVGFWLLDKRDFGIEFSLRDSVLRTLREFTLVGNSDLVAYTAHARWFFDSVRILGGLAGVIALFSLFRPLVYRLKTLPQERLEVKSILESHGRSSLDFFKLWPDKSYFFSADRTGVIAYHVTSGVAICLGDPVGPSEKLEQLIRAFLQFSSDNGWSVAFQHTLPDLLPLYRQLGLDIIKIGEEAVVDLDHFVTVTAQKRDIRQTKRKIERAGYRAVRFSPPHPNAVINEAENVSREWLSLPGRHERGFTLGQFNRTYIQQTPLFTVVDASDHLVAFVNEIPAYRKGEATVDLMRHRTEIPNGTMDFLFLELLTDFKKRGYQTFNFGLAPLAGVGEPGATLMEHGAHYLFEHLGRYFSFKGLRNYKDKFEPTWEDRFLVYQGGSLGLLKAAIALTRATEGWRFIR